MRICAIGDPHGDLSKVKKIPLKDVDLIILTGDLGKSDLARKIAFIEKRDFRPKEFKKAHTEIHNSTISLLKYLSKFVSVYSIQGNVGVATKGDVVKYYKKYGIKVPSTSETLKKMKINIVKNKLKLIDKLRIGFLEYFVDTIWVKTFKPTEYGEKMKEARKETVKARKILKRFGRNLDILVCHQPPYGILDKVAAKFAPKNWQGKHAGSKAILDYIRAKQPRYVFCGHIHEGEGMKKIGKTEVYNLGVAGHKIIEL